jgi:hypothetical protein
VPTASLSNITILTSTTLAISIERSPDLPAAVWASVGRSAGQGGDDGFSDGRQRRLRGAGRDSFFPARGSEAKMLEEGVGDHGHQRRAMTSP